MGGWSAGSQAKTKQGREHEGAGTLPAESFVRCVCVCVCVCARVFIWLGVQVKATNTPSSQKTKGKGNGGPLEAHGAVRKHLLYAAQGQAATYARNRA